MVSILVLVDAALRREAARQCHLGAEVSILVLVDAALRRDLKLSTYTKPLGFNPCFSGCRSATIW